MKLRVLVAATVSIVSALPLQAAVLLTIPEIQGSGDKSTHVRKVVKTTGVVTVRRGSTFYIQDANGDGNAATSDAIVVKATNGNAKVGDLITVEGTVIEDTAFGSRDQLSVTTISPAVIVAKAEGTLPVPVVIGTGGIALPTEIIAGPGGAIELLETLEGMYVRIVDAQVVGPTSAEFSEFWVVPNLGAGATGMNSFGGITAGPTDLNPEKIQVQLTTRNRDASQAKVGDKIAEIEGALNYSSGNFEIIADKLAPLVAGPMPVHPAFELNASDLTIGSYNVENLDPKLEDRALLYTDKLQDQDDDTARFATIANQVVNILKCLIS